MPIYDAYILPIRAYPSSYRQNIGKIISRRGTNEGKIKLLIRDIPSKGDKAKRRDIKIAKTLTSYYGVPHTYWYNIEMANSPRSVTSVTTKCTVAGASPGAPCAVAGGRFN